jgi:nitric oxide reductase subunit B
MNTPSVAAPSGDRVMPALRWALAVVLALTAAILAWGTVRTYQGAPPLPSRFITASGQTVMTETDIVQGKAAFQESDLMDYGSLYGNGAYYGEDYTAQALVALGRAVENQIAVGRYHEPWSRLGGAQQAVVQATMQHDLQTVRRTGSIVLVPAAVGRAMQEVANQTAQSLLRPDRAAGWTGASALTPLQAREAADFIVYSAWTTVAHRPGTSFSYTNNWPYEPLVGNTPTPATFLWTWVSIGTLLLAIGAVLWIYHQAIDVPDAERPAAALVGFPALTPSQRKTGKYFVSVAVLFLLQIAAGILMAHDYADRTSFYGMDINGILPFNFLKAVHLQLAIFWIAFGWIGAGLFLAPFVGGEEPKHQGLFVDIFFGVLWALGLGTLFGLYAGIKGWIRGNAWFWFGNQGLEYLQLGRFYQILLFIGLIAWALALGRALWPALKRRRGWTSLEHLLLYSALAIGGEYVFGMFPVTWIMNSFTLTDFWRWWVVHLWVEGAFEFFAVVVSAYLLMALGLVSRRTAERVAYFEAMLVFLGGDVGIGHHFYWIGEPWIWLSLGSMFSFLEVLPLVLLVLSTLNERRLLAARQKFPHALAYRYLQGSALWNFVGAGVFGGLINAPLINYYEHGTFLTLAHAHTAMFGAFGLLGLGLVYVGLRYLVGDGLFDERLGTWAFWLYNAGMVLWLALNFFPIGWAQLLAVYEHGYAFARSLAFYQTTALWQWLRMPGDVLFATGALLMAVDFIRKLGLARARRTPAPLGPRATRRAWEVHPGVPAVEVEHVTKTYPAGRGRVVVANDDISFTLDPGQIVGLLGPNGAGKSTLLRQLVGLGRPTNGSIRVFGAPVRPGDRTLAEGVVYLPQATPAFGDLTVREAVHTTALLRGLQPCKAASRTAYLLERLGLERYAHHLVGTLSGGEKRLCAIATALVVPRPFMALDEPTNELDPLMRRTVWELIRSLREPGRLILLVSHNVLEAEQVVDRVLVMSRGRLFAAGTPDDLRRALGNPVRLEIRWAPEDSHFALGPVVRHDSLQREQGIELLATMVVGPSRDRLEECHLRPLSLEEVYLSLRAEMADGGDYSVGEAR